MHNQPTTSSYVHHLGFQGLKKIIIIAGPNGAGKTTFAKDFLPSEAKTLFDNAGVEPRLVDWIIK